LSYNGDVKLLLLFAVFKHFVDLLVKSGLESQTVIGNAFEFQ
jgi:hypothetical protein